MFTFESGKWTWLEHQHYSDANPENLPYPSFPKRGFNFPPLKKGEPKVDLSLR
jgi:hypothetical protein